VKLTGIVKKLDVGVGLVASALHAFGSGILAVLMFFTVVDVALRYFLSSPIKGDYDISSFMMGVLIASGLALVAVKRGHIGVDVLTTHLPKRVQAGFSLFGDLITLGLLVLMVWQAGKHGSMLQASGTLAQAIRIPIYPFVWVVTICLGVFAIVVARNIVDDIWKMARKAEGGAT
jgi:TRAP-type C4-dicarboxylate transport system permease small subunit